MPDMQRGSAPSTAGTNRWKKGFFVNKPWKWSAGFAFSKETNYAGFDRGRSFPFGFRNKSASMIMELAVGVISILAVIINSPLTELMEHSKLFPHLIRE